jgi:hypothetical protein
MGRTDNRILARMPSSGGACFGALRQHRGYDADLRAVVFAVTQCINRPADADDDVVAVGNLAN